MPPFYSMKPKIERLREKASTLPDTPGVYLMKRRDGTIVYVGKSRKLRQRVSSYFTGQSHTVKTARMVATVEDFDYILCDSEIEALGLENTLIKQYAPKYNIKLKDAKSYPYLAVTAERYPRVIITRERRADGSRYFGPYSGTADARANLETATRVFHLPTCRRRFPEDIGRERPCIYRQMGRCVAPCAGDVTEAEYRAIAERAASLLSGNVRETASALRAEMMALAEEERFEAAARVRDSLLALEKLGEKQRVLTDEDVNCDVFGLFADDTGGAIAVLCIRDGALNLKNEFHFSAAEILSEEQATAFIAEYYRRSGEVPREVLLSFAVEEETRETLAAYLRPLSSRRVAVKCPRRGASRALCDMADKNAREAVEKYKESTLRTEQNLVTLASLLALEVVPDRIEVYDISNLGEEHTTASMIVYEDGRLRRNQYRTFRIESVTRDDYGAMREALSRRLSHIEDAGAFGALPDLILLDGGAGHVRVGREAVRAAGLEIPVFGLVKDEYHKTRAMTDGENEIAFAHEQALYVFLYKLQEEVHRRAVSATMNAKRKTLRRSTLEDIPGIGKTRARLLLTYFGGLKRIKSASVEELSAVRGMTASGAAAVYARYHPEKSNEKGN